MKSEIENNLILFLNKYSHNFNMSSVHLLIEEYLSQKYLHKNKIYGYNVINNNPFINIHIHPNHLNPYECFYININVLQLFRKLKLQKLYPNETSL